VGPLFDLFSPTAAVPKTDADIHDLVGLAVDNAVFAYIGEDNNIHVIHQVARFHAGLEAATHPHHDKTIGVIDETNAITTSFGFIDREFFTPVQVPNVPPVAAIQTALDNDPNAKQLAVFNPAAPGSTNITVRCSSVVPPSQAADLLRLLDQGPVTPRDLWPFASAMEADPVLALTAAHWVDWCRVAVATGIGAANAIRAANPADHNLPESLAITGSLAKSRLVKRDVAFLHVQAAATAAAPNPLDALVAVMQAKQDAKDQAAATAASNKKSPKSKWPHLFVKLCRICHVPTMQDSDLPECWPKVAATTSLGAASVIQAAAMEPPDHPEVSLDPPGEVVISNALAIAIGTLNFGRGREDTTRCLGMSMICYPDQASIVAATTRNGLFRENAKELGATIAFDNILDESKAQVLNLPATGTQFLSVCFAFHRLLQILLGERHLAAVHFFALVRIFQRTIETELRDKVNSKFGCAGLMRSIDLATNNWITEQVKTDTPLFPSYERMGEALLGAQWRPPPLPELWKAVALPPKPSYIAPPSQRSPKPPTAQQAPAQSNQAGPAATSPTVVTSTDKVAGIFHENIDLGVLRQGLQPGEMDSLPCLRYHLKGKCFDSCLRKETHRKLHATELASIKQFLSANPQQLAAAVAATVARRKRPLEQPSIP
jgi:hypothetical protein